MKRIRDIYHVRTLERITPDYRYLSIIEGGKQRRYPLTRISKLADGRILAFYAVGGGVDW